MNKSSKAKGLSQSRGGAYARFMAMNPKQRAAEVAHYDREDLSRGKALSPADKALHQRAAKRGARTKMGRPKIGKGAKIVPVTIERGLLKQTDRFAKQNGLKRSQVVAQGLRLVMQKTTAA
jgi:hypothetical protein